MVTQVIWNLIQKVFSFGLSKGRTRLTISQMKLNFQQYKIYKK